MTQSQTRDIDREIDAVVQAAWVIRAIATPIRHLMRAWETSQSGATVHSARQQLAGLSSAQRLRLGAVTGAVAMIVHIVLVLLDARAVEPLALLLPAVVLAVCLASIGYAGRMAKWLERVA